MSKHVFCRPARQSDTEKFLKWSLETENNLFDPKAALHPSSLTVVAYNKDKTILYAPSQSPFVLEALAFNPASTPLERAAAMKEITQWYVSQAYVAGKGEILFVCADESTAAFAKNQQYEELPYRLFRLRVSDLEPDGEE